MLSAFAARKRLLAKTSESRSPSATEDDSGGSARSGAQDARGSEDATAGDGTPRGKRAVERRKRQRVETAASQGQENKVAVRSEATVGSEETRQSTAKREIREKQSRTPVQQPTTPVPTTRMDLDDENRSTNQFAQLKALGAVMETPAR